MMMKCQMLAKGHGKSKTRIGGWILLQGDLDILGCAAAW